jgi:hypothetical protein
MSEIANRPNPLNQYSVITTTYLTATDVTGSTSISGSSVYGATGKITNITATNVTGSTSISGSTLKAGAITATASTAAITGVAAITGSNTTIYGNSGSISFGDFWGTATGSVQTALGLKVIVTGSTYYIPLYR